MLPRFAAKSHPPQAGADPCPSARRGDGHSQWRRTSPHRSAIHAVWHPTAPPACRRERLRVAGEAHPQRCRVGAVDRLRRGLGTGGITGDAARSPNRCHRLDAKNLSALDADPRQPYVCEMLRLLASPEQIGLEDLDLVDMGHPWKTNLADLTATLLHAGFRDIQLLQRSRHVSRLTSGGLAETRRIACWGRAMGTLMFWLPRKALQLCTQPPLRARKALFGFEKRMLVGRSRLKNLLTPEVLALATNPGH